MPIPEQRDLEKARTVIGDWLARRLDVDRVEVGPITGPAMTGFSNETLLFDASWTDRDGVAHTEGFVVRVKPTSYRVFLESDFEQQFRVLQTLGARTDVPVPRVHWYEDDESVLGAPFFLMSKVDGQAATDNPPYTVTGFLFDATPQQRDRAIRAGFDAMIGIHRLDWRELGLGFLDKPQYGSTGVDQQLGYYEESFAWAARGEPDRFPVAKAGLEWLRANKPPPGGPVALCWGDARVSNQMFDDDVRLVAVLDWEMATLGDPLTDVGLFLLYWGQGDAQLIATGRNVTPDSGFMSQDEVIERYAQVSGRSVDNLDFYVVLAAYKLAIIVEGIHARFLMGKTLGAGFDAMGESVVRLAEWALDQASRSSIPALRS